MTGTSTNTLTITEKLKLFKLYNLVKEKEFRFEISYSERYLKKIKKILSRKIN